MASRSLNKVLLIGNVVRDPEVRFTAQNTAVANFTVATNRSWNDSSGQAQEESEFSRVVVWGKLAEIVGQIIQKGRKVYVEGRLQTREWEKDGVKRQSTEIVAENVIALDSRPGAGAGSDSYSTGEPSEAPKATSQKGKAELAIDDSVSNGVDDLADDIPF